MSRRWDIGIGIAVAALSAAVLISLPYQEWVGRPGPATMAPEYFPRLVLIALVVVGLVLAVTAQLSKVYIAEVESIHPFVFVPAGIAVFYTAAFDTLGFMIATVLTIASFMWAFGERRLPVIGSVAIVTPLTVGFVVESGLGIMLP